MDDALKQGKVKPRNLDTLLGRVRNRIYRVGIEAEGGWVKIPGGRRVEHDGSVFRAVPLKNTPEGMEKGEIKSEPLEIPLIPRWLKECFPEYVNETCGLHVHQSFKNAKHYSQLMDYPEYPITLIAYLAKWATKEGLKKNHPIWRRLQGKERYCRNIFWPDLQAVNLHPAHDIEREGNDPGHRYTFVNYCHPQHETIEVRGLPMFSTPELCTRAVHIVLDVTNAFIAATGKREKYITGAVDGLCCDEPMIQKKRVIIG